MLLTVLSLCALVVGAIEPECGVTIYGSEVLVFGGKPARRGEVPWHAGIYRKSSPTYNQICGGSLISKSIIISAAHCFWNGEKMQPLPEEFAVAVGKTYNNWESNETGEDDQKSDVKKIYLPDHYLSSDTNYQDDLAVVEVTSPFQYTKYVRPVCIHFDIHLEKRQLQPGNYGKVAGWGLTEIEDSSQILRLIELPYIDIKTCFMASPFLYISQITSDKFCAGYINSNKAVCMGDSGGGLAFPLTENGRTQYYLRGVVSSAPDTDERCNTKEFTLFTHLLNHEHFIKEILELDQIQNPKVPNECNRVPSAIASHKTGRKAWDKCIEYQEKLFPCSQNATGSNARPNRCHQNASNVLAGNDAVKNEFPNFVWIAAEKNITDIDKSCSGSFISERFVLTSANCISWHTRSDGTLYVVLGMSRNSEKINNLTHFKIKRIHVHPGHKYPSNLNDIGLLELEKPVTLSEFLVPACLHTGDNIEEDTAVTVYWRSQRAENFTLSYELQKLLVTKSSECAKTYEPYGLDTNTQLCYKRTDSSSSLCNVVTAGGSPLQVKNKKVACMNTIVGVTSIAKLCRANVLRCSILGSSLRCDIYPWAYTRVASYIEWIENIVWPWDIADLIQY